MAKLNEKFRPYAAPANVIAVIERCKKRNLPDIINYDFLRVVGIPEMVFSRIIQTLKFLGLIYDDQRPTETLNALSGATDAQYKELLEKVIREAYRVEFNIIDPSQDPLSKIIDSFKPYEPRSQITRMATLFLGLCHEAGISVYDAPRNRRMQTEYVKKQKDANGKSQSSAMKKDTIKKPESHFTTSKSNRDILFGITEEDVGVMSQEDFDEVWSALGKVARARAKAKTQAEKEVKVELPTEKTDEVKTS